MSKVRRFSVFSAVLFFGLFFALAAWATEWIVPDDPGCETIQGCISQASDGDTITVKPGTYLETIDFLGKAITVRSANGPATTIIEGGDSILPVVTFASGEGNDSVLEGFTVKNSQWFETLGIGINCSGSSPIIRGNKITSIVSMGRMSSCAGIMSIGGSPIIEDNHILKNLATAGGDYGSALMAGIYVSDQPEHTPPLIISNNKIVLNGADTYWGYAFCYGIYVSKSHSSLISQNTIFANGAQNGDMGQSHAWGIFIDGGVGSVSSSTISQNTISRILADDHSSGIWARGLDSITVENNIVSDLAGLRTATGISTHDFNNFSIFYNTVTNIRGYVAEESSGIRAAPGPGQSRIIDNIIAGNRGSGLKVNGGPVEADFNDVWGNTLANYVGIEPGPHDISKAPLFVSPNNGDYHLQKGSPCIDKGTDVGVTEDIDGDGRPKLRGFDMGADEVVPEIAVIPYLIP